MAKYDHGGGCPCGLQRECDCGVATVKPKTQSASSARQDHPEIKSPLGTALATMLRHSGFPSHRIAALFDVNQGRVAEAIGEPRDR